MELVVLFVIVLAVAVYIVEWANKKFSEMEEREAKEKAEESDTKIETASVPGKKPDTEKEATTPHHTGVVIKGRRKVEGKDTTVSAGRVYPIYTYEPDKKAAEWRCIICDAENSKEAEICCVCQHPRAGNEAAVSYPCPGVSPPQGEVQKNQSENAPEIDVQPSEKAEEKPIKKAKKKWPVLCAAAVLVLGVGWLYSMGELNKITPSEVVDSILQKEVEINGTSYDVEEASSLKAEVIRTQEDVDNIGKLTNLTELSFIWSGQSDVDLSALSNLTQLTKLTVSCPNASVISFDFLQELTNIKELTLISTGFHDADAISGLPELTTLNLSNNEITDDFRWGIFASLKNLESLNVSNNSITNIAFLLFTPSLKILDVSDNNVTSVSPLTYCPKLETLKIDMISDIGVLQSLAKLDSELSSATPKDKSYTMEDIYELINLRKLLSEHISVTRVFDSDKAKTQFFQSDGHLGLIRSLYDSNGNTSINYFCSSDYEPFGLALNDDGFDRFLNVYLSSDMDDWIVFEWDFLCSKDDVKTEEIVDTQVEDEVIKIVTSGLDAWDHSFTHNYYIDNNSGRIIRCELSDTVKYDILYDLPVFEASDFVNEFIDADDGNEITIVSKISGYPGKCSVRVAPDVDWSVGWWAHSPIAVYTDEALLNKTYLTSDPGTYYVGEDLEYN